MKKFYYLALCALVGLTLNSCGIFGGGGNNDPKFNQADLLGLWQENNTEHFVRFSAEQSDEEGYLLGCEWNEDEDVHESDLIATRAELGHPGNGWFKYELKTTGTLTEIHLMDTEGAEIPKVYIVSKLADGELVYYEKDRENIKFSFTKLAETK